MTRTLSRVLPTVLVVTLLFGIAAGLSGADKGDPPAEKPPRAVGHPSMESPQFNPIAALGERVFVANTPAGTVDVIDAKTRKVVTRIPVGIDPVCVAVRPDGKEVWVANHVSDSVSVIDTDPASPTFLHVVATVQEFDPKTKATKFDEPVGIAFASNEKAYVALSSENQVAVIDVASRKVTKRLSIPAQEPRAIAVRNGKLYVVPFESHNQTQLSGGSKDKIDGNLVTFDAYNHSILNNNVLSVGHVVDIVKHPKVPDRDLFVFDTKTDTLVATVESLGTLLYGLAVDGQGNVFVAQTDARNDSNGRSGTKKHGLREMENRAFLNRITKVGFKDGKADKPRFFDLELLPPEQPKREDALATPFAIHATADDATLVATAAGSDKLFTVNATSGEVLGRVDVGAGPRGIALDGHSAWVLNALANTVTLVDLTDRAKPNAVTTVTLDDPMNPVFKRGRIAFNTAKASTTGTFSCASCHPDGHTDQLLWVLDTPIVTGGNQIQPRSTMPARGLRDTAPFHWDGIPGDPYGGIHSASVRKSVEPNSKLDPPTSVTRHLIDGGLASTMHLVGDQSKNDEGKLGELTRQERDDMAVYLLGVPYPPAPKRAYTDEVSDRAKKGFRLFHIDGDHDPKQLTANVCGNCHRMPFLVSTNTPGTGMDAPTWRGAQDRWLILPQGRLNIIDFDFYRAMAEQGAPERNVWQLSWGYRNRFDPVWDMVLEMGTGFSGAFARQATLNKTTAKDEQTADLLAALERAADDGAVVLECDGVLVTEKSKAVAVQFLGGKYVVKTGDRSAFTRKELLALAADGKFVGTFTARHGAKAGIDHPQPAIWTLGPIERQRGRQAFPILHPDNKTMTVSGRHFGDDARLFVNGRRVAGTVRVKTDTKDEAVEITLVSLPPEGLHLLQVQVPDGPFSNEFLFHVAKDATAAEALNRDLIRQSVTPWDGIPAALSKGDLAEVKKLIRDKATANGRLSDGNTPLSTAALRGHHEVVKYLLDTGADPSARNADGNTPLHAAAFLCREEVVKLLLEKGASVSVKNSNGQTPVDVVSGEWTPGLAEFYGSIATGINQKLDLKRIETDRPKMAERLRKQAKPDGGGKPTAEGGKPKTGFPKTASEYAKMAEAELGVPPKIDLSECVEIPIYVKGVQKYGNLGRACDNPSVLGKDTVSGSTLQRHEGRTADGKPLPDVVWVSFARNSSRSHDKVVGSVQMIGYNKKTGATAFFESCDQIAPWVKLDKDTFRMRGVMPWIDKPDEFDKAFRPPPPGAPQCVQCHQADPFITNSFINAAKLPGTKESVVPVLGQDSPYYVIGGENWDMRTIHIKGNKCFECHRVGMSTMDLFQKNGWDPNKHMPPHDPGSLKEDLQQLLDAWKKGPETVAGAEWIIPPARGKDRQVVGPDYPHKAKFNVPSGSRPSAPSDKKPGEGGTAEKAAKRDDTKPAAADWAMYNHDPAGWRFNPAEKTLGTGNVGKLVEKWRFPATDSKETIGVVHATPTVVNGEVYFGTATFPAFYKLDKDGKQLWVYRNPTRKTELPPTDGAPITDKLRGAASEAGIFTSALVADGGVYFADTGGWMYRLDAETGKEVWTVDTRGKEFPGSHWNNTLMASPLLADGKVIFAGGTLEQLFAGTKGYPGSTGRGFVVAVEPKTGKVVWKYDVGPKPEKLDPPVVVEGDWGKYTFTTGPATSSVWSTPTYDGESNSLFFGTDVNTAPRQPTNENADLHTDDSCAVVCLDAATGKRRWNTQLNPGDVWTNTMRAYDSKTGLYKDCSIGDSPKVFTVEDDGKPIKAVGVGCKNGGFYLLRADSGKVIRHTPLYTGKPTHPPEKHDPRVLALPSPIGGLQSGCATDGKTIFTNGIDALRLATQVSPFTAGQVPTGGRVTATSVDQKTELWRHERPKIPEMGGTPGKPMYKDVGDIVGSGVAVGNGVAYFTAVGSGKLIALDAATGKVLKEIDLGPVFCGPSLSRGRVYIGGGNTLWSAGEFECFFPKQYTGRVRCFGLPDDRADDQPKGEKPFAPKVPDDVTFRAADITSEGTRMAAEVFAPKKPKAEKLPTIVMSHGWGGTADSLRPDAIKFAQAGYLVVAFDYRGWGNSDSRLVPVGKAEKKAGKLVAEVKEVREVVDPIDQTTDILNAISWAAGDKQCDPNRIGIWGSSFSGGHVVYVAARDPRVKAFVSQVGSMDGRWVLGPSLRKYTFDQASARTRGEIGYPKPLEKFGTLTGAPVVEKFVGYAPIEDIGRCKDCAKLFIIAEKEELFDNKDHAILAHERATGVKKLVNIKGIKHYGIYNEARDQAQTEAIAWFDAHLKRTAWTNDGK